MSQTFRANVAAFLVSQGQVLLFERAQHPGVWQVPQGGLEPGESPEEGVYRELYEEIGLSAADLCLIDTHPCWLGYELPDRLRSSHYGRGQVQKWFVFDVSADACARMVFDLTPEVEFSAYQLFSVSSVLAHISPFKKEVMRILLDWVINTHPTLFYPVADSLPS